MISFRPLSEKDAPLMLECLHDPDIQKGFKKNLLSMTLDDALSFIKKAVYPEKLTSGTDLHYAIVDESDEYLGTISLKNISAENRTAEFAVMLRKAYQGNDIAHTATMLLLKKAFEELGLHRIYLSVYSNNAAAIRLYEKCGFRYEGEFREHFLIDGEYVNWKWYGILKEEFEG